MTESASAATALAKPRVLYVGADGKLRADLSIPEIADVIRSGSGELWVDLDVGTRSHLAMLDNCFGFHPLAVEDVLNPNSRVKVDEYSTFIFAIIRGVRLATDTEDPYDLETFNLPFFLGANYLVTVHGGQSPAHAEVAERVRRNPELLRKGAERVMHAIMDAAVDAYFPLLDQIDEFIEGLEDRVFSEFDRTVLQDIFAVKRLVLSLRRHIGPQREALNVLTNRPSTLLAAEAQVYFRDVYDHTLRLNDSLETFRDLLGSTLDSYLTQVSNRLGAVTKGLSVIATISIPFVVISGMWGMNFRELPLADSPHAFWYMLVLQLGIAAVLLILLRVRRLI